MDEAVRKPAVAAATVGDIATPCATRPANLRCRDIERKFSSDPALYSLIVLDSSGAPVLVDRGEFLIGMMGQPGLGPDLNYDRPVEDLVDPDGTFVIPARYCVTDAYDAVLSRPAAYRFSPVVVEYPDGTFGMLSAARLLEQVAQITAAESLRDSLTGLANRTCLMDALSEHLLPGREVHEIGLLFIDLDRFKIINDGLGHAAGDHLLAVIADRIRSCMHGSSLAARLGGDEFAVLIDADQPGGDVLRAATECAERILDALADPVVIAGQDVFTTASIGIALTSPGESASTLVRRSDIAMYQAKHQGGNSYYVFETRDDEAAARRLEIEGWLRRAVTEGTLAVHYQPIVSLARSELTGFEALVRGTHPTLGNLAPDEFLPIAAEIGMLPSIDRHVLHTALRAAAAWRPIADRQLSISVNVSSASLQDDSLLEHVSDALNTFRMHPGLLTLEVTESGMLQHPARTAQLLGRLRQMGVRIAIDDFGTGYSSLTQITTFQADVLKIDRSFVTHLRNSDRDRHVVEVVIALAHGMRARTVAEGVEDAEQAMMLLAMGCERAQGYLFAPALDEQEALALVRRAVLSDGRIAYLDQSAQAA